MVIGKLRSGSAIIGCILASFLAVPAAAQQLEACNPELLVSAEYDLPDLIVIDSWKDIDVSQTYNCDVKVAPQPAFFGVQGESLGKVVGLLRGGDFKTVGSGEFSSSYWVVHDSAGSSFAVPADDVDLKFADGGIDGLVARSSGIYPAYNKAAATAVFGPDEHALRAQLWSDLSVAMVALNPVPTDRTLIRISSEPAGAEIWIDSMLQGRTELTGRLRNRALSKLRLTLSGYEDCEFSEGALDTDAVGGQVFFCTLSPDKP